MMIGITVIFALVLGGAYRWGKRAAYYPEKGFSGVRVLVAKAGYCPKKHFILLSANFLTEELV